MQFFRDSGTNFSFLFCKLARETIKAMNDKTTKTILKLNELRKEAFKKVLDPPKNSINGSKYYAGVCQGYDDAIALLLGKETFTDREKQLKK